VKQSALTLNYEILLLLLFVSTQYEIGDPVSNYQIQTAKRAFDCFSFTFSIKEILLSVVFVLGSEMMKHLNKDSNSCLTSALLITAIITTTAALIAAVKRR
jgi:hypothetical protein